MSKIIRGNRCKLNGPASSIAADERQQQPSHRHRPDDHSQPLPGQDSSLLGSNARPCGRRVRRSFNGAVIGSFRGVATRYHPGMEFARITIDPAKMRGAPCIRGLRILVATVLGQLAAGRPEEEVLADFPDLEPEDIRAALEYAAAAVQERELPLTRLA